MKKLFVAIMFMLLLLFASCEPVHPTYTLYGTVVGIWPYGSAMNVAFKIDSDPNELVNVRFYPRDYRIWVGGHFKITYKTQDNSFWFECYQLLTVTIIGPRLKPEKE
jgi:hypothetical protein